MTLKVLSDREKSSEASATEEENKAGEQADKDDRDAHDWKKKSKVKGKEELERGGGWKDVFGIVEGEWGWAGRSRGSVKKWTKEV